MDKKTYSIGILSLSALILFLANFISSPRAEAVGAVNPGRDVQVVTGPVQSGGDALYLLDNRTGMIAVFSYDAPSRRMIPRAVAPASSAFQVGNVAPAGRTGTSNRMR